MALAIESLIASLVFFSLINIDLLSEDLNKLKIKSIQNLTYPNHFQYGRHDVKHLLKIASEHGKYSLLTTSKDFVRFNDKNDPNRQLRDLVDVLDISVKIDQPDDLMRYISQKSMN